ncbi:hypothetical protein CAJAP_01867 [Camponotus japonicus]
MHTGLKRRPSCGHFDLSRRPRRAHAERFHITISEYAIPHLQPYKYSTKRIDYRQGYYLCNKLQQSTITAFALR